MDIVARWTTTIGVDTETRIAGDTNPSAVFPAERFTTSILDGISVADR